MLYKIFFVYNYRLDIKTFNLFNSDFTSYFVTYQQDR